MVQNTLFKAVKLIETYINLDEKKHIEMKIFRKYNCMNRGILLVAAGEVGIPLSVFEKYIFFLKAYKILSTFTIAHNYTGYIFDKKEYNKLKKKVCNC